MKFGLKEAEFNFLERHLIQPLKEMRLKVFIFGSRVSGRNHPFSDVDMLIEGSTNSEIEAKIIHIKDFFEDSNFPYKIDLVYEKNLAKSYRDNVMKERIEL